MRQRLSRHRTRGRFAQQNGYSLPEVLIAALILAIGIGALLTLFADAGKGSQTSSGQDLAAATAAQELENMRSYSYSALALSSQVTSLPDGRLVNGGTQFQATSKTTEDLVASAAGSALAPAVHEQLNGRGYTVYRVVSWADQSCPVSTQALSNAVARVFSAMNTVEATLNSLNGMAGLISQAQAKVSSLITALSALPLMQQLVSELQALAGDIGNTASLLSNSLPTGLQSELSSIQTDLGALQSQNLIDSTGHLKIASLDLCHLPKTSPLLALPNVTQLSALATALSGTDGTGGVEGYLSTNSNSVQVELTAAAALGGIPGLSAVLTIDSNLAADNTSIQASMSSSGGLSSSAIGAVHNSLTNLKDVLNCVNDLAGCSLTGTHVTKRISVAVVLDATRAGVGPQKAVWMSSLVTDPSDGLL